MRLSERVHRIAMLAIVASLLCVTTLHAKKPDKPGGGGGGGDDGAGQNGGGMIFFDYNYDDYTMLDDGSEVTLLDPAMDWDGLPSRNLHGGKRWFARKAYNSSHQITVVSDAGDVASLVLQSGLEIVGRMQWGIDDALISIEAVLWDDDPLSATFGDIVEAGLYLVYYSTDSNGNLIDGASIAVLAFGTPAVEFEPGLWLPVVQNHDWAPDGIQFVFNNVSEDALYVGEIVTGQTQLLFDASAERFVYRPLWSPAGDRILFDFGPAGTYPQVMLINPDGSNLRQLASGAPGWTKLAGAWSPTGSHMLLVRGDHRFRDSYIIRMTADGTEQTRLTKKSMAAGSNPTVTAWRE